MVPTLPAAHVTQYRKRCCWPFLAHSSSLTHSLIYLFICSAVFTASGLLPDFVFNMNKRENVLVVIDVLLRVYHYDDDDDDVMEINSTMDWFV